MYDKGDRLVLTQDGNRRSEGKWLFRAEDLLGRECLTGILSGTFNAFGNPLSTKSVLASRTGDYATLHGYSVSGIGLTDAMLLGVNWWDDYGFIGEDTLTPESSCGYDATAEGDGYGVRYTPSAQGLLTGSLTGIVGNTGINGYLWRSLYYDAKGRVVQERAARGAGVTDKTSYAYDYRGNLIGRRIAHTYGLNTVTTETYTYAYDGWGRPTTTTHQLGSGTGTDVTLSSKSYDKAGRLTGDARNGSSGLNTAYSYNVRSWLTDLSVGSSGSTFQQKLYYNAARDGATATAYQWGGNIARMDWKAGGEERTYQFGYDLLSRLTGATHSGPGAYSDNFTRTYGYDQNGNVTSRGENTMGNNWQLTTTSYTYDGNHLSTGTYDANGNLTAGLGYTTTYNLLNLPETVETQAGAFRYLYAADGTKLMKSVSPTGSGGPYETELQYAGNLVFRVLDLEAILVEGGYIDMTGTTPVYRFYVTDHQGNIRAVTDGTGTVLRSNHYDPYGEEVLPVLTSASTLPVSTAGSDAASRYMYGAKEWDNSVSLYDFSARWYNPASAVSFTTMDPLCEKYFSISPYAYCAGNPVNLVDYEGQFPTWLIGVGLDYGTQVYENYQRGKSGWDAWGRDINLVRLGLSAVTPGKKLKVAKTLIVEATKASVSASVNDGVLINTNVKDVAEATVVGTVTDLAIGSIVQKGSPQNVSDAGKKVNTTAVRAEKANRKAMTNPKSTKMAKEASLAEEASQMSREQQVLSEMIHSIVGNNGEKIEKVINQVIQLIHEKEEEKKR